MAPGVGGGTVRLRRMPFPFESCAICATMRPRDRRPPWRVRAGHRLLIARNGSGSPGTKPPRRVAAAQRPSRAVMNFRHQHLLELIVRGQRAALLPHIHERRFDDARRDRCRITKLASRFGNRGVELEIECPLERVLVGEIRRTGQGRGSSRTGVRTTTCSLQCRGWMCVYHGAGSGGCK